MEQRRFHRVTFSAPGDLIHHDMTYRVQLGNISLRGALISADECIMVPLHETCTLSIWLEEVDTPLILTTQVVHSFFSMVGVKFVSFADDAESRLFELLKKITSEPDNLRLEWEEILAHRAGRQDCPRTEFQGKLAAGSLGVVSTEP
jgi:hypothetical protein